jgi:hypothetical protein
MSYDSSNARMDETGEAVPSSIVQRPDEVARRDPDEEVYRRYLMEKYGSGNVFPADASADGGRSTD